MKRRRHRRGAARRRARDLRALRADPRLARRPWGRARDPAGHPRARPAPVPGPPPEMVNWLAECAARGDAIAQHGFQHRASAAAPRRSDPAAEFLGLDADETRRAVEAGRRVLRLAGVRPRGFVAPAYAYTGALRETLAGVVRLVGGAGARIHAPGALDARARADARHLERASSAWPRRGWCARAPWPPGTCCASICIRPTSTIRATSARWKACSSVRTAASATPSPTTTSLSEQAQAVLRANWREGVHRDGTPYAFTCPASPRYRHQWHWDSCFHAIAWCRYDSRARARSCARSCAAGAPTASSRTPCSGTPPALAPGAALRDPARARQPPHDDDRAAAAGRSRGSASRRPAMTTRASPASR